MPPPSKLRTRNGDGSRVTELCGRGGALASMGSTASYSARGSAEPLDRQVFSADQQAKGQKNEGFLLPAVAQACDQRNSHLWPPAPGRAWTSFACRSSQASAPHTAGRGINTLRRA